LFTVVETPLVAEVTVFPADPVFVTALPVGEFTVPSVPPAAPVRPVIWLPTSVPTLETVWVTVLVALTSGFWELPDPPLLPLPVAVPLAEPAEPPPPDVVGVDP
jgi:hypothetical protein